MDRPQSPHKHFALYASYHAFQKFLKPFKLNRWRRRSEPFWHIGVKGLKFNVTPKDYIESYIYLDGIYEKPFLYLLERVLVKRRTALDVGANIGNHSLFLSTLFKTVHSFEPNPDLLARLKRNLDENDAAHVHVHGVGLSNEDARLPFHKPADHNKGVGRFVAAGEDDHCVLEVRCGDAMIAELGVDHVDFIKVDVEGHELHVLQGLRKTIAAHQPVIAFEFHAADFPEGYFDRFPQTLPGYRFFECAKFERPGASLPERAGAYIARKGLLKMKPLSRAAHRSYDNILAFPADFDLTAAPAGLIVSP